MTIDVIKTMARHENICNHIHLPIQSGSDRILKKMNRLHTRQEYLELIKKIKEIINGFQLFPQIPLFSKNKF